MSTEPVELPEVDLGDGRTVISYEGGTLYRVRMPNGEVQGFPPKAEATPENAVDDIVTNPPPPPELAENVVWQQHLEAGWTDAGEGGTGLKLKTTVQAQNRFVGLSALIDKGLALAQMDASTQIPIYDFNDERHLLPVSTLQPLLFRYGMAWAAMFDQYAP